jgi:hypothetical protein
VIRHVLAAGRRTIRQPGAAGRAHRRVFRLARQGCFNCYRRVGEPVWIHHLLSNSSSTLCSAKCGRAERKSLIARECLVCCIRRRTFCSVTSWRSVCRFLLICWWVWRYDRNDSLGFPCSSAPKPAALAPTC